MVVFVYGVCHEAVVDYDDGGPVAKKTAAVRTDMVERPRTKLAAAASQPTLLFTDRPPTPRFTHTQHARASLQRQLILNQYRHNF